MLARGDPFQVPGTFRPDSLMAPLLTSLWMADITTRASCQGHLRHGQFSAPYISVLVDERGIRFLNLVQRWRWCLMLPWVTFVTEYNGQKWASVTVPAYRLIYSTSTRRRFRLKMRCDIWLLGWLAASRKSVAARQENEALPS